MTLRHKKLIENLGKTSTVQEAMIQSGYKPSTAHQQSDVLKSAGFEELLAQHLPDSKVMIAHQEGLEATKVISAKIVGKDADGNTDDFIEVPDHPTRLKAAELAYRVKGRLKDGLNVMGDLNMTVNIIRHNEASKLQ